MATFSLESSVNTLPDTPILPNYAGHPVVLAKIIDFSVFKDLDPREVFNTLKTYFNSRDMIVIACSDTPQPVPLQQMTLEALEFAMLFSVRSESQTLLGDGNVNAFNDYKTAILANDQGSEAAMEDILKFSFVCILEAISTRTVKKGALYLCPFSQRPVMLLGSRSLYFSDKGRIKAAEQRAKKAANRASSGERTGLPKDDTAYLANSRRTRKQGQTEADVNEGYISNQSIEDVSCHGGDGDSPYPSEWEHQSQHSAPATPTLQREDLQLQEQQPIQHIPQLSLPPNALPQLVGPAVNTQAPNIRLAPSSFLPLESPGNRTLSLGQYATPLALGGTLGSVPDFGKPVGTSSKRKSRKSKKNKSKKSKHSRSRSSRSRSSSSSSSRSVEVPPPKPSVDQVLFYMPNIFIFFISLLV